MDQIEQRCLDFVKGAKWWEWVKTNATMWQSDQKAAYEAAQVLFSGELKEPWPPEYAPEEHKSVTELEARVKTLEDGIRAYIDGDTETPRDHRPGNCPHGIMYWSACEQCNCEYFERLLNE